MAAESPLPPADDFIPLEALQRVLRGWWLLAICVFAGGIAGLLISALRPAQYEAGFTVIVGIEQTTSGEIAQYDEDVMFEAVGGLFYAPAMMERVTALAAAQNISVDSAYLRTHSTVERRLAIWLVRVRHTDPSAAETLARIWLEEGTRELRAAYANAVTADGLQRSLESLESCLVRAAASPPADGQCSQANLADLQAALKQTGAAQAEARLSARGLSSSLLVRQAETDILPARPVLPQRAGLALAGAMAGFLVGIWAASAWGGTRG
jgi:LPS O-antigen subunit length determinant protein (WzzB/FepE family)